MIKTLKETEQSDGDKDSVGEPTLNRVIRPGPSKEATSELRPADRSRLNAGRRASAEALENKLRLFGEQTEGPVCLGYRELEGG